MARFPFPFPRRSTPYPPRRRVPRRVGIVGAIALLIAALAAGLSQQQTPAPSRQTSQPTANQPAARPSAPAPATAANYETFDGRAVDDPVEVREIAVTLADIADGTPDRFRADRELYENRGHHLPEHPRGFWRAFTVITPGENDRGPRRLVVGTDGSVWFTRDHYRSFVRLRLTTGQ